MIKIEIAGIKIQINNRFAYLEHSCRAYLATFDCADITVAVSQGEIAEEKQRSAAAYTDGYYESICAYRTICRRLPYFDAFMLHASAVEINGQAYAFCGKSGVGKSTHTKLLLERYGGSVRIINGDKPVLRLINGRFSVFGTPWCGKEGLSANICAPLKAITFLVQARENRMEPLDLKEAALLVMPQLIIPIEAQAAERMLALVDGMLGDCRLFRLHCNISPQAAELSYTTLTGCE